MSKCEIFSIDHIVMTVTDMSKTIDFYCSVLGTTMVEFVPPTGGPAQENRCILANRKSICMMPPHPMYPMPKPRKLVVLIYVLLVSNRLMIGRCIWLIMMCLLRMGRCTKLGANGALVSLYIRDPDGNLIEISNYI